MQISHYAKICCQRLERNLGKRNNRKPSLEEIDLARVSGGAPTIPIYCAGRQRIQTGGNGSLAFSGHMINVSDNSRRYQPATIQLLMMHCEFGDYDSLHPAVWSPFAS